MAYSDYGGAPGTHQTGPIVSEHGFRVGKKGEDPTEIINGQGEVVAAQMPASYMKVVKVALTAGNADAFAFAWQNPESSAIMVHRVLLDITTESATGGSVINIGSGATATTESDNLIDGGALTAAALLDNIDDQGTNGKSKQRLDAKAGTTDYVTGRIKTAHAAALVGNVYIYYTAV